MCIRITAPCSHSCDGLFASVYVLSLHSNHWIQRHCREEMQTLVFPSWCSVWHSVSLFFRTWFSVNLWTAAHISDCFSALKWLFILLLNFQETVYNSVLYLCQCFAAMSVVLFVRSWIRFKATDSHRAWRMGWGVRSSSPRNVSQLVIVRPANISRNNVIIVICHV